MLAHYNPFLMTGELHKEEGKFVASAPGSTAL
jgi:hypothetical protein